MKKLLGSDGRSWTVSVAPFVVLFPLSTTTRRRREPRRGATRSFGHTKRKKEERDRVAAEGLPAAPRVRVNDESERCGRFTFLSLHLPPTINLRGFSSRYTHLTAASFKS